MPSFTTIPADLRRCAVIALLLLCATVVGASGGEIGAMASIQGSDGSLSDGITISVPGPVLADSVQKICIEGVGRPTTEHPKAPFAGFVYVNHWMIELSAAMWDETEKCWCFAWTIPPGLQGAQATITLVGLNGAVQSRSVSIN